MKAAREAWFEGQLDLDPAKLIFIDETGASTKMARLRDRAKRGQRCRAAVPHGHWKTTTFTAGLSLNGMVAPMVLDGPMNGDAFLAYIHQVLMPELETGMAVIMDNLPAHKVTGVRQAIEEAGAGSFTCRPIRPTSIQSKWHSPNSRPHSEKPPHAQSPNYGTLLPGSLSNSSLRNAKPISPPQDMTWIKSNPL